MPKNTHASSSFASSAQVAANTAALADAQNARQSELDAAVAALTAADATLQAAQAAHEAGPNNTTQAELDAAIAAQAAAVTAEQVAREAFDTAAEARLAALEGVTGPTPYDDTALAARVTAAEVAIAAIPVDDDSTLALKTDLHDGVAQDAAIQLNTEHAADTDLHLPTATAGQQARRNAAGDAWEAFTPENFVPIPLPADGSTLELKRWYQGREGSYTIPNGTSNEDFLMVDNPSNLKGESTRALFAGKFAFSSDGTIFDGELSVSPNGRWRLYWDMTLDGGAGAWRIHSNRPLLIPVSAAASPNILLSRNNSYGYYNGTSNSQTFRVPSVPGGQIKVRFDGNSVGGFRVEMEDTTQPHNLRYKNDVNSRFDFGKEYAGKEFSIEVSVDTTGTVSYWNIYVEEPDFSSVDIDHVPYVADTTEYGDAPVVQYKAGDTFVNFRLDDFGDPTTQLYWYRIKSDWVSGTDKTGLVWDATEEARYEAVSAAEGDPFSWPSVIFAGDGGDANTPKVEMLPVRQNVKLDMHLIELQPDAFIRIDKALNLTGAVSEITIRMPKTLAASTDTARYTFPDAWRTQTGEVPEIYTINEGEVHHWKLHSDGFSAYIWPLHKSASELAVRAQATVTFNGADPQEIFEDAGFYILQMTLADGMQINNVGTVAGANISKVDAASGLIAVQLSGGTGDIDVPVSIENVPVEAASFKGYFPLGAATQYFIPTVTGTYDLVEQRVLSTNHELLTEIRRVNTNQQIYYSTNNRITNANTQNVAQVNLFAGNVYSIDPVGGGGTTSGSHKIELTLRP